MKRLRGAPNHPQAQGKIKRWRQTLKNQILLHKYNFHSAMERQIAPLVTYYNYQRYHESITNFTPANVYLSRTAATLAEREKTKRATIVTRRLQHQMKAA